MNPLVEDRETKGAGRENFSWALKLVGLLFSVFSCISFVEGSWRIGLTNTASILISYYRSITHPIVEFLPSLVGLHFPSWYLDLAVISGVATAAFFQAVNALGKDSNSATNKIVPIVLQLAMTYSLFGLLLLAAAPVVALWPARERTFYSASDVVLSYSEIKKASREFVRLFAYVAAATAAFYALNNVLPQPART